MATVGLDGYKLVFQMPLIVATQYFQPISSRLVFEGIHASTIRSGWGASAPAGGAEILLEVEFTVDKGSKTEAQITTLANDISVITGTALRQIVKTLVNIVVPATPLPTVNAPNTVVGTDISGVISVGVVGTTPIVLTFGSAYSVAPICLVSWTTNLCQLSVVSAINKVTFQSNNSQINNKKISYLIS